MTGDLTITPDDELTRFTTRKKKNHARADNTVKPAAFKLDKDLTVSTYKTTHLQSPVIYDIGETNISEARKPIKGRVIIEARHPLEQGLTLDPDNVPERHVSIRDWPDDRDKQLQIAELLAASASYEDKQ